MYFSFNNTDFQKFIIILNKDEITLLKKKKKKQLKRMPEY